MDVGRAQEEFVNNNPHANDLQKKKFFHQAIDHRSCGLDDIAFAPQFMQNFINNICWQNIWTK